MVSSQPGGVITYLRGRLAWAVAGGLVRLGNGISARIWMEVGQARTSSSCFYAGSRWCGCGGEEEDEFQAAVAVGGATVPWCHGAMGAQPARVGARLQGVHLCLLLWLLPMVPTDKPLHVNCVEITVQPTKR